MYGILTAQLSLTVLVVVLCLAVPQCKALVHGRSVFNTFLEGFNTVWKCVPHSPLLSLVLLVGTIVTLIALIFKRHDTPTNYYLLVAFVSCDVYLTMTG